MSGGAHVDVATLDGLATALSQFARDAPQATAASTYGAQRAGAEIDAELAARQRFLFAAQSSLAACQASESKRSCAFEAGVVATATERLSAARRAKVIAMQAIASYAVSRSRIDDDVARITSSGGRLLALLRSDVERYATSGGGPTSGAMATGTSGGSSGAHPAGPSGSSAGDLEAPPGFPAGWAMVPLSRIDGAESDPGEWKHGVNSGDLQWGLSMLHEVVMPALAAGKGLDYFQQRDGQNNWTGSRSLSDTYLGFFRVENAVQLESGAGGRYTIGNGRHRVWLAREAGLDAIPVFLG